jgi:hypothetical protein
MDVVLSVECTAGFPAELLYTALRPGPDGRAGIVCKPLLHATTLPRHFSNKINNRFSYIK